MKRRLFLKLAAAALAVAPGCETTRESHYPVTCFPRYTGATPGAAPCDRCRQSAYPPVPYRPAPPPAVYAPGSPATSAYPPAYANVAGAYWAPPLQNGASRAPFESGVRLLAPVPDAPDSVRDSTSLYGAPKPQGPAAPPVVQEDRDAPAPLPVDVPQFAIARDRVANGLQPFPDGIAWLQTHGYRTVLHVRAPGEGDSAARRQFEKHGLRYLSLEASPKTLSREIVEQFDHIVTDEGNLPLFVYDRDGSLAGGLWYLYYRTSENATDEKARTEAARLGFSPDADGEQRTMWVAIQNYLRNLNP